MRLHDLLRYAILAPSRHNAQPWLFEIHGAELRVFGDWRRSLSAADPQGRELVMACGAALYNVEVAARHFGHAVSVEVLAGSRKDGMLARLTLEEQCDSAPAIDRMFAAIPARRTNRFGFDSREVPRGLLTTLTRAAVQHGARLKVIDEPLRPAVAELVREGDARQWSSARYRAELGAWSRSNELREGDGMPGYAHGLSDSASLLQRVLVRLRSGTSPEERRDRQYVLHARGLLALCTDGEGPAHWLAAGRAMQCVLLRAASEGLSASFFSQAVQVPPTRQRLRDTLGERGWPQLLLRLGFGREVLPTPRRPVSAVLRSMSSAPPERAIVRTRPTDHGAAAAAFMA